MSTMQTFYVQLSTAEMQDNYLRALAQLSQATLGQLAALQNDGGWYAWATRRPRRSIRLSRLDQSLVPDYSATGRRCSGRWQKARVPWIFMLKRARYWRTCPS
jgi:hypothetical protein